MKIKGIDTMEMDPLFPNDLVNQEAAYILLDSIIGFLSTKILTDIWIATHWNHRLRKHNTNRSKNEYRRIIGAYLDMGAIIFTWYLNPKYLNTCIHLDNPNQYRRASARSSFLVWSEPQELGHFFIGSKTPASMAKHPSGGFNDWPLLETSSGNWLPNKAALV